jgi:hypothetical protein
LYDSETGPACTSITALLFIGLLFDSLEAYEAAPEPLPQSATFLQAPLEVAQPSGWHDRLAALLMRSTLSAVAKDLGFPVHYVIKEALRQKLVVSLQSTAVKQVSRHTVERIRKSILAGMSPSKITQTFHVGWYSLTQIAMSERSLLELWHAMWTRNKPAPWRDQLSALVSRLTIRSIAKEAGVGPREVLREALRQKLTIPLPEEIVTHIGVSALEKTKKLLLKGTPREQIKAKLNVSWNCIVQIELSDPRIREAAEARIDRKKAEILAFHREQLLKFLRKRSPYRGALSEEMPATCNFLRAHDRAWFESQVAAREALPYRPALRRRKINWQKRDKEFAGHIRAG